MDSCHGNRKVDSAMKIIHLSDLHFGTEESETVNSLRNSILTLNPDLLVISGDFTQVGSTEEYIAARDFLTALDTPFFCVPGNHDIPRYNLLERFINPYRNYRRYITDDLCPVLKTDHAVIAGLNTARRMLPHWNWAHGAVSDKQLDHIRAAFDKMDDDGKDRFRICVMHHPVQADGNFPLNVIFYNRERTLDMIRQMDIDLVLTGHVHHADISNLGGKTVFLSASTALSTRLREHENGFNLIDIDDDSFFIRHFNFNEKTFHEGELIRHNRFRPDTTGLIDIVVK